MMVRKDDVTGESFTLIDFDNTAYGYRSWERKPENQFRLKPLFASYSNFLKRTLGTILAT